jgi:hypothetical protein
LNRYWGIWLSGFSGSTWMYASPFDDAENTGAVGGAASIEAYGLADGYWHSFEFALSASTTVGSFKMWLDGEEMEDVTITSASTSASLARASCSNGRSASSSAPMRWRSAGAKAAARMALTSHVMACSRGARQSSTLYGTNLFRLTEELCKTKDGVINVNMEDDAIRGLTVVKNGEITWPAPALAAAPKPAAAPAAAPAAKKGHGHGEPSGPMPVGKLLVVAAVAAVLFVLVGAYAPAAFLSHFTVFVLACFVGYMVVWNVKPALHTPLMSVTNAISSIIAIGALVQISPLANSADRPNTLIIILASVALVLTAINMFGGFAVTQRMLAMFRK